MLIAFQISCQIPNSVSTGSTLIIHSLMVSKLNGCIYLTLLIYHQNMQLLSKNCFDIPLTLNNILGNSMFKIKNSMFKIKGKVIIVELTPLNSSLCVWLDL